MADRKDIDIPPECAGAVAKILVLAERKFFGRVTFSFQNGRPTIAETCETEKYPERPNVPPARAKFEGL